MSDSDLLQNLASLDFEEREKELLRINEELDQKRKEISQRADTLLKQQETLLKSKIDDSIDLTVKDVECIRSHFDSSQSQSISANTSDHEQDSNQLLSKNDTNSNITSTRVHQDELSTFSTASVAADARNELVKHSKDLALKYDLECNPRSEIPSALHKQASEMSGNQSKKSKGGKKRRFQASCEMKESDFASSDTHSLSNNEMNKDTFDIDNEFLNDGYSSKQVSQRNKKASRGNNCTVGTSENRAHKLSSDCALRLQKARFKVLEKKFQEMIEIKNEKDKKLNELNKQLKTCETDKNKLEKKHSSLQAKYQNQCEANGNLLKKIERLECENGQIKRELKSKNLEKMSKQDTIQKTDIRLNRALEEAEKYRKLLIKYKNENMSSISTKESELDAIKQENKKLEKQKVELLSAFRKQMKLIDILKKQKIHLEAAKVLQFTEDQFVKTLDIGQKLMQK